ncbi:hypothetical protein R6Q57_016047 [Mikania cordata]
MRKGTFDELRDLIRSAMVALILNKPFNFSAMIFIYMSDNITKAKDRFYMYPRFIQMLIDERFLEQNLPRVASDILKLKHMTDSSLGQGSAKYIQVRWPWVRLLGFVDPG